MINLLRYFIIAFIIIFILSLIPNTSVFIKESYISDQILNHTPILSHGTKNLNKSLTEIYDLVKSIDEKSEAEEINRQSLEILLKYGIIKKETVNNLNKSGKIKITNLDLVIEKY